MARFGAALIVASLFGCGVPYEEAGLPPSPLDACPGTPNCVRTSRVFAVSPAVLADAARGALADLGGVVSADSGYRIDATFRVVVFTDDVAIAIEPVDERTVLHVRSASRVGHWDVFVNGARVRALLAAVARRVRQ